MIFIMRDDERRLLFFSGIINRVYYIIRIGVYICIYTTLLRYIVCSDGGTATMTTRLRATQSLKSCAVFFWIL